MSSIPASVTLCDASTGVVERHIVNLALVETAGPAEVAGSGEAAGQPQVAGSGEAAGPINATGTEKVVEAAQPAEVEELAGSALALPDAEGAVYTKL